MLHTRVMILNFPKISLEAPPLAPGLLSAICKRLDIDHDFIDCNLEFHQQLVGDVREEILSRYAERFIDDVGTDARAWLDAYFDRLILQCESYDLIAISVFSAHSVALTYDFLVRSKSRLSAKIVVGGSGIRSNGLGENHRSAAEPFYQTLWQQGLIEHWVLGEGEKAFENILLGNLDSADINNHQFNSLPDFVEVPVPSFDKFHLDHYRISNKRIAPVEGSRGCVKKCTFCDINKTWGRFKYKDGNALANEIIMLQQRYDIDHFWFNDSLINGSMKAFRDFTAQLARRRPPHITWSSQAIVRPRSGRDREDFELMKASGCSALAVGLESFSEKARFHMGKKFTDDDLDSFLSLAQEFDISIVLLLIVGYPTETQDDIDHAMRQLEKYNYLADDGTISFLRIGNTMSIIPETPIWYQVDDLGIDFDPSRPSNMFWTKGTNTLQRRLQWRMDLEDHAKKLGYNCLDKEMHVEQTLLTMIQGLYAQSDTD